MRTAPFRHSLVRWQCIPYAAAAAAAAASHDVYEGERWRNLLRFPSSGRAHRIETRLLTSQPATVTFGIGPEYTSRHEKKDG